MPIYKFYIIFILLSSCQGEKSANLRSSEATDIKTLKSDQSSSVIPPTEVFSTKTVNGSVNIPANTFDSPVSFELKDVDTDAITITALNSQASSPSIQKDIEVCINTPEGSLDGAKIRASDLSGRDGSEIEGIQSSTSVCIQTRMIPGLFALVLKEESQLSETLTFQKNFADGSVQMNFDSASLKKDNIYFIENPEKTGVMEGGILDDSGQEVSEWLSKSIDICWNIGSKNITTMTFLDWNQKKTVYKGTVKGESVCFKPGNFIGSFILGAQEISTISTDKSSSLNATPIVSLEPILKGDVVSLYTDETCEGEALVSSTALVDGALSLSPRLNQVGVYKFYAQAESLYGGVGSCSKTNLSYTLLADLNAPTGLSLISPSQPISFQTQPVIQVNGVEAGATVSLYNDSNCQNSLISADAISSSIEITLPLLTEGDYVFYAKASKTETPGKCSQVSLAYKVDTTTPVINQAVLHAGAPAVASLATTFNFDVTGTSSMYITETSDCSAGGTWESYQSSKNITLPNANTSNTFYVQFQDEALNKTACVSDTIIHDNIAPTSPSLTITGGIATSNQSPNLILNAADASEMYITNTAGCSTDGAWETYATSKSSWNLGQTNTVATVYVKYRDSVGNESNCVSDTIVHDNISPSGEGITIDGGTHTADATPNLTLTALGAHEMYITNTAGCSADGAWESYATSKTDWNLGQTDAIATVYTKFKDEAGNESACINDTITHDSTTPSNATLVINGGTHTADASPDLTLTANDASEMYITNTAGCSTDGAWETYATSKSSWNLDQTNAAATVYVKFRSAAGIEGSCVSGSITHDDSIPTSTSLAIDGGTHTSDATPDLTLAATGANEMYITNTAGCSADGAWESYATSKTSWSLGQTNATATVYTKFKDEAGNESACINDTIIHDNIGPTSLSLSLDNDASVTASSTVNLTISATDAQDMYVTNTAG
ncbi:MAG: hypothetical protein AB8C84_04920, partial [Oligoflexales bacterium]